MENPCLQLYTVEQISTTCLPAVGGHKPSLPLGVSYKVMATTPAPIGSSPACSETREDSVYHQLWIKLSVDTISSFPQEIKSSF